MKQNRPRKSSPASVLLLALLGLTALPSSAADLASPSIDVLPWPRMPAPEFGCYMEKALGYRDSTFNCATRARQLAVYEKNHDACEHPKAFHDGLDFPDALAARVHPLAEHVALQFQGGSLQEVIITLKGKYSEADVRKAFRLPASGQAMPENIMRIEIEDHNPLQGKPQTETDVRIAGFDFLDAMDLCGGD